MLPSMSTSSTPSTLLVVMPYFRQCTPPEFYAALHDGAAMGVIDLEHAVELAQSQHDRIGQWQCAPRERRAGTTWHDLEPLRMTIGKHCSYLRSIARQYDGERRLSIGREAIAFVGGKLLGRANDALAGHELLQRAEKLGTPR